MEQHEIQIYPASHLDQTRQRFEEWRANKQGRSRIPQELWDEAVVAADDHGLPKVSHILRLNYSDLKKRMMAKEGSVSPEQTPPIFVELGVAATAPSSEWSVVMEDGRGAKMSLRSQGLSGLDVVGLATVFWSGLK